MQELRYALRTLLKHPGFTAVAILTLALGIGANTAIFSVVDAVVLRPLPYPDPDRVMVIMERAPEFPTLTLSVMNFPDVRDQATSYRSVGAARNVTMTLTGDEPVRVNAKMLTADVLDTLGVPPIVGRNFKPDEDAPGGRAVAIISYGLWQSRFAGASDVLSRKLDLDGQSYDIVGVLPPSFRLFQPADVFVPMWPWLSKQPKDRGWHPGLVGIARLKDSVSTERAQREMDRIGENLERAYRESNLNVRFTTTPMRALMVRDVRGALFVLLGAVAGVLLIACINVAGLLLARGAERRRELAVRTALGAGRGALVRQLLAESGILALAGAVAGIALAAVLLPALVRMVGTTLPRADAVGIDARVLLFTIALAMITALVFGLVPALTASRVDVRDALQEGGRGNAGSLRQRKIRSVLVVAEVAVTVILLVGAGLLMRSFVRLQQVSPGFSPTNLVVAELPLSPLTYNSNEKRTATVDHLLERARAIPGATNAAVTTVLPVSGPGSTIHFNIQSRPPRGPQDYVMAGFRAASRGFFDTMQIPVKRGRALTTDDRQGSPHVVVVNEAFVHRFFPTSEPIGQRLSLGTEYDGTLPWMEVVGVIGDTLQTPDAEARAEMYVPYEQYPDPFFTRMYQNVTLVVRSTAPVDTVGPALRQIVKEIDRNQPIVNFRTMNDVMAVAVTQPRFRTVLLGLFAGMALLLAAVGIFGLLAHGVVQRRNEFGVRLALGATPQRVVKMVIVEGLSLTLAGVVIGLFTAMFAVRLLASALFAVTPRDPLAWGAAAATIAVAALVASWLPARRAIKVDPAQALRV